MASTTEKLQKLESILVVQNAPVLPYLNPRAGREDLLKFFGEQNIEPIPSLIALYEWHNGVRFPVQGIRQSVIEILPMGIFYSLDQLAGSRKDIIRWNYMERPEEYVPLFGSGEDDIFLLKYTSGEIFYLSPAAGSYGEFQFKSIDGMLEFIIECYEQGIFWIDPSSGLEIKEDEYSAKLQNI